MSRIIPLPGASHTTREVGHYIRLGDTGYKILEDLVAEGRFPAKRVVVDASRHVQQANLIEALSSAQTGLELILDTKCAELATLGKYRGVAKDAPWSQLSGGQPLDKNLFPIGHHSEVLQQIAEFAIQHKYAAILGTGHFLKDGAKSDWLDRDIEACSRLIELLDDLGASHIGVDYSLVIPHTLLNDQQQCGEIIDRLRGVPFQNLWIRASGFGADAGPLTTQRYLRSITQFHQLRKPVIADHVGGLVGFACAAFGAVSGLSHGIGEKQRFDASSWHNPPALPKRPFGRAVRMSVPGVQTSLTTREIETLAQTPAGRRLVACNDRDCCEGGLKTMLDNPRRHSMRQTTSVLRRMEKVPLENRPRDFLGGLFETELRAARELARLRPKDEKLASRLENNSKRMDRLYSALDKLATERETSALRPRQVPQRAVTRRDVKGRKQ